MSVKWTEEQQKVIDLRNRNILVSAAAGSGKTAVLVERIIQMLTDREHPVAMQMGRKSFWKWRKSSEAEETIKSWKNRF